MANALGRILIAIGNFVLWASGILLLVFGAVALGSPSSIIVILNLISGVEVVTNLIDIQPLFNGVAIFMVVLGSILFLFGIAGAAASGSNQKPALMLYWILLIIGVLVEIALIIYSALFPASANPYIQKELFASLTVDFQPVNVASDGSITYSEDLKASSWEVLQSQSHCCGAYEPNDYKNFTHPSYVIPPTCCISNLTVGVNLTSTNDLTNYAQCKSGELAYVYLEGCWHNVGNMVWNFDLISIIICSCLIVVQLLLIPITVKQWRDRDGIV